LSWGIVAIEADCGFAGAGVALCHLVVDFLAIGADGCPMAGDLVCHLVVDLSAIGADGCPKAGDLVCHSVLGLWFIEADEETRFSGGVLAVGMSVAVGAWLGGMSSLVVHSIPSNLKVLGGWRRWRWGDLVDLGESVGTSNLPRISSACCIPFNNFFVGMARGSCCQGNPISDGHGDVAIVSPADDKVVIIGDLNVAGGGCGNNWQTAWSCRQLDVGGIVGWFFFGPGIAKPWPGKSG
jgi:hypothetical protein